MSMWEKLGVRPADILLPDGCNAEKWACVACDQFTSDEDYWNQMQSFVGDEPSTLKITFPEIYLGKEI